jgi:ribonuclease P protein component
MVKNKRFVLPKAFRLHRKRDLTPLFSGGKRVLVYPLLVTFSSKEENSEVKCSVVFSMPKKRWRKAVNRNKGKRIMREALRLTLPEWEHYIPVGITLHLSLSLVSEDIPSLNTTSKALMRFVEQHIAPKNISH